SGGAEVDALAHARGGRGRRVGRPDHREQPKREGRNNRQPRGHASTSVTGLADLSTIGIGRFTFDRFFFSGSMPSALHSVARRSGTLVGRSSTFIPSLLVAPTACPPLIPPPASTAAKLLGQWSRPLRSATIFGVRPNSPIQMIVVVSSSPRSLRSAISVDHAGSSVPQRFFTWLKLSLCVSQLSSVTSTNGTPRSTSRRASRHPWP